MQQILRDMLIWLITFFGISAAVLFLLRWSMIRVRARRAERLRTLESRLSVSTDGLGLPIVWINSTSYDLTAADRAISALRWLVCLGLLSAGIAWSAQGNAGWNWNGVLAGAATGFVVFVTLSLWLYCRQVTFMPAKSRRLATAIRCWAIRLANGLDNRMALEQSARQLQRFDPELARCLESAAVATLHGDHDMVCRAFYPCGTGVSERMAEILSGKVPDPLPALRALADQLDTFYQNQSLLRVKRVDGWLKYPIILCLLPASNLLIFGPAVANLIDSFGVLKFPPRQAAPLANPQENPVAPPPAEPPAALPVEPPETPPAKSPGQE